MKQLFLLPLLFSGVLGDVVVRRQTGTSKGSYNSQSVPRYSNSSLTTTSKTITTTRTAIITTSPTSISTSIATVAEQTSVTLTQWSDEPTLSMGARPTCLADATATFINTIYPIVTSTVEVTETLTLSKSRYHDISSIVVTESSLPPCAGVVISESPTSTRPHAESYYPPKAPYTSAGMPLSTGVQRYTTQIITKKTIVPVPLTQPTNPPVTYDVPSYSSGNRGGGPGPGNRPGQNGAGGLNLSPPSSPTLQAVPGIQVMGGQIVYIGSTAVVIGSSTIPLPVTRPTNPPQIIVNEETFTILPSQIIGPGTTYNIPLTTAPWTITQSPSTVAVNGIVITVGPSEAIISGTHYRIGIPSNPQTITIDGQTVTLNSNGVIFPSTTLSPAMTVAISGNNMYKIIVLDGMTFSIDASEAVISGTTFKIGQGAGGMSTATMGSEVITIGSDGLVVGGTTIDPITLDPAATMTATTAAAVTNPTATPTNGSGKKSSSQENAATPSGLSSNSFMSTLLSMLMSTLLLGFQF